MADYNGGPGDDLYDGSIEDFAANINGNDGNDQLYGTTSGETLRGGNGNDLLFGAFGITDLGFFSGNGLSIATALRDFVLRASANDFLSGGNGDDAIYGGDGKDTIYGDAGNDGGVFLGNEGNYYVGGLFGGEGDDSIYGHKGNDDLYGGNGNDLLYSNEQNDRVFGEGGNDNIRGGYGLDVLDGGAGADSFYYKKTVHGGDTIVNFASEDVLHFKSAGFGGLAAGKLKAANYWASTTGVAHDATDRFIYDTDNFVLYYDSDGTGAKAAVEMMKFETSVALTLSDLLIVA